jgi:sulfane dehydrogenase subunit SoxC
MKKSEKGISRRELLAGAAVTAGAALLPALVDSAAAQSPAQGDPSSVPGGPTTPTSARSPFEAPARTPVGVQAGSSLTPLHQLTGTMTPNDLMFERHHSGVPALDPSRHKLVIHGLVDRPMTFMLDDLKRFPTVSRIHFLECSGNGRAAFRDPKPEMTAQNVDGLTCNGEWTGVTLATVLRETGIRSTAKWFLAEGGDAAKLSRSIPLDKAMDDALIVWAFNGEALRPSNGYPFRLLLPGYEGNANIKWLRRLKLTDQPNMSKDETSKYTDPLTGGKARMFSFVLDVKSIITTPSTPMKIERGWREISGVAWSGRGKVTGVEVSTDSGKTWEKAELHGPVHTKAHTRFSHMWDWNGRATTLMSRATDETGAVQPTRAVFGETRGKGTDYHYTHIRAWNVAGDGRVTFAGNV